MGIPNPLNIADDLKSDCTTYSSNKIENLISVATELPTPAAGDAGKVLTVNSDSDGYELDVIPAELPTPAAGDAGKVLSVNASENGYELESLASVANTGSYTDLIDKPTILAIGSVNITGTTSGYGNLANDGIAISVGHPFLSDVTSTEAIVTFYLNAAGTHYIPHVTDPKGDIIANTEVTMTVYYIIFNKED